MSSGWYCFNITRQLPGLRELKFLTTTNVGDVANYESLLAPTFSSGIVEYRIPVPFIVRSIQVSLLFDPIVSSIVYDMARTIFVTAINSTYSQPPFQLNVGTQYVHINSSTDGVFTFNVSRAAPDVTNLVLTGWSTSQQQFATSYSPVFVGGNFSYNATVLFIVSSISVVPTFKTPKMNNIETVGVNMVNGFGSSATSLPLTNTMSSIMPLVRGAANYLWINSSQDGQATMQQLRYTHLRCSSHSVVLVCFVCRLQVRT